VTWVWLSSESVDFGEPEPAGAAAERTVWLHADPHRMLGLSPSTDEAELRRRFRQVARSHHPDLNPGDPAALSRFHEAQQALAAATGAAAVTVEPISGEWWSFTGFDTPPPWRNSSNAIAGLNFEVHDLRRIPLRDARDTVRITYAGQALSLGIAYSGSRHALPLWRARLAAVAEYSLLVLLCLTLLPVLALLVAADLYLLSGTNDLLAWGSVVVIVGLGYGALAAILAASGNEVPTPRRAIRRTRAAVAELRALGARTKLG
jgi:DnaJ-like protein